MLVLVLIVFAEFAFAVNQKPIFHLTPEDGHWINDPNGPFYDAKNQKYHVFAQYNPNGPYWGDMSWTHWISDDLVMWKVLPVAITNDQSYDKNGAFSGSTIVLNDNNAPILVYTCVDGSNNERQCYAYPSGVTDVNYTSWIKPNTNPVIDYTSLPTGFDPATTNFRDPTAWQHSSGGERWSLAAAAELNNIGTIVRYDCTILSSPQTFTCDYFSNLWSSASSSAAYSTYMVECPDFYPILANNPYDPENKPLYVLKYSVMEQRREFYELGSYDEAKGLFLRDSLHYPSNSLNYDYGPNDHFYASKTFYDAKGAQQVLFGWLDERDDQFVNRNWAGALSLPRKVVYCTDFDILRFTPIDELQALRIFDSSSFKLENIQDMSPTEEKDATESKEKSKSRVKTNLYHLPVGSKGQLNGLNMEIQLIATVAFNSTSSSLANDSGDDDCNSIEVGILSRQSTDGTSYVRHGIALRKYPTGNASYIYTILDSTHAGGSSPSLLETRDVPNYDIIRAAKFMKNDPHQGENMMSTGFAMTLFLDESVTELYTMHGASASTLRIYPDEAHTGVSIYTKACVGDKVMVRSLQAWNMRSIWD